MSVKIYQNLVNQIKDVIDSEFGIMDDTGLILACSDEKKVGQSSSLVSEIMRSKDQFVVIDGQTFQKVYIKNKLEFITFIDSDSENSQKFLALISINTINVKNYFDEKYDKISFIKGIIMDNILPGDITLRAKELHLQNNVTEWFFLWKPKRQKIFMPTR